MYPMIFFIKLAAFYEDSVKLLTIKLKVMGFNPCIR